MEDFKTMTSSKKRQYRRPMIMTEALVPRLCRWFDENRPSLAAKSVSVPKQPAQEDAEWHSSSIGFSLGHILVSFRVWDRSPIEIEVLVYNARLGQTVIMHDYQVNDPDQVFNDLDRLVSELSTGKFDDMAADPELSIT